MSINLAKKNKEVNPESWEILYGHLVEQEFRKIYSQSKVEAIVNNYLCDPTNEKYVTEFKAMQEYREQCKVGVRRKLGIV